MTYENIIRQKDLSFARIILTLGYNITFFNPTLIKKIFGENIGLIFSHQSKSGGTTLDYFMILLASVSDFITERATVQAKENVSPNLFVEGSIGTRHHSC